MLDIDAVRATERLISRGFEAYLVGGCVRDLLLGRTPKDYDIATEARPPQVKRVFPRNCRIIGRRFKLAHLHFHGNTKILECSTFRRAPQPGDNGADVLITQDNEFGTAEEDALRRDFTVNALFLDPTRDTIYDFADGLQDVRERVIRTIGDPVVRFREDPVRILRAAKFAGRLGFTVEEHTLAAMAETSGDLVRSAPPRVLEEILRLLRGGHALDSFQLLRDVGALRALTPVLAEFLADASHDERVDFWHTLDALDQRIQDGHQPPNGVLLGALLVGPVLAKAARNPGRSATSIAEDVLGPLCAALRLPKRDAGCLKRICGVQHRFLQPDTSKRFRIEGFLHSPYFFEALDLFEVRMLGRGQDATDAELDSLDHWRRLADQLDPQHGFDERADGDRTDGDQVVDGQTAEVDADEADPQEEQGTDGHSDDEPDAEPTVDEAPAVRQPRRPAPAPAARTDDEADLTTAGDDAADTGDEATNPWHGAPAGDAGQGEGDGRRRRRRRRRRRGGREDDAPVPSSTSDARAGAVPAAVVRRDAPIGESLPEGEHEASDAPTSVRARPVVSFVHPEGEDDAIDTGLEAEVTSGDGEIDADIDVDAPIASAGASEAASDGDLRPAAPTQRGPDAAPDAADEGRGDGRRRRRRRRRGRGRDRDEAFPRSEAPAPHGDAVAPREGDEIAAAGAATFPRDADAPRPDPVGGDEGPTDPDAADGEPADAIAGDAANGADGALAGDAAAGPDGDGRRRRRRRRGRRGRGRRDEHGNPLPGGDPLANGDQPEATPADAPLLGDAPPVDAAVDAPADGALPAAEVVPVPRPQQPHGPRQQQPQHGQRQQGPRGQHPQQRGQQGRGPQARGQQGQGQRPPGDRGQGQRGQHGQQGHGQQGQHQQGQGKQHGQGRRDRDERRRDRRHGGPRDVDVVPRHRDRRGKVEVIEPPPLDLSAFDVELDPKRVPTFGSIVEGKGRPKRRSPRVPEDGVDDYKPPPPPGSDAPPPAPPPANNDSPDTFGDW